MGTRSTIGVVDEDGFVQGIYCHWDGYPEHNGRILRDHYTTPRKIMQLIKLGDLSSLGAEIGRKHNFMATDTHNQCTAYKRDRGEKGTEAQTYKDVFEFLADDRGQDYTYLYVNGKWECRDVYNKKVIDLYAMVDELA